MMEYDGPTHHMMGKSHHMMEFSHHMMAPPIILHHMMEYDGCHFLGLKKSMPNLRLIFSMHKKISWV